MYYLVGVFTQNRGFRTVSVFFFAYSWGQGTSCISGIQLDVPPALLITGVSTGIVPRAKYPFRKYIKRPWSNYRYCRLPRANYRFREIHHHEETCTYLLLLLKVVPYKHCCCFSFLLLILPLLRNARDRSITHSLQR